tara:strand:+ start:511 stop:843 length:333 start_codon:yes stop_codon:yes gene_type:complete
MRESELHLLIASIEERINELEVERSEGGSIADKKRSQAGDAAASLDLMINTIVGEKILSEHKLELAQLINNLSWLQTADAGVCEECGRDIPIERLKAILSTRLCVVCADS